MNLPSLATLLLLVHSLSAASLNDLTYEIAGDNIVITDCHDSASGKLVIPSEIVSLPVTSIANNAFDGYYRLEEIQIPIGIVSIGELGFHRCSSLTSITLPSSLEKNPARTKKLLAHFAKQEKLRPRKPRKSKPETETLDSPRLIPGSPPIR